MVAANQVPRWTLCLRFCCIGLKRKLGDGHFLYYKDVYLAYLRRRDSRICRVSVLQVQKVKTHQPIFLNFLR
jgi:hypothetical protein